MKRIYTTVIFLAIMSIFSLAASAQATNGSQNGMPNGMSNGVANSSGNGQLIASKGLYNNGSKAKIKKERSGSAAIELAEKPASPRIVNTNSPDNDQINYMPGMPGYKLSEFDRYGYQGMPLSTNARPCLVSGARRCVQ